MVVKGILFLFLLVSLSFFVAGQEIETVADAGTTPDSFVWGIDRAIERIELALTFDSAKKERKRLENAYERLLEVRRMVEEGKIEQAEKAKNEHVKILKISKEKIGEMSADDDSELNNIGSFEDSIEMQENEIEDLDVRIRMKGTLSDEQKKIFQDFISSLGDSVGEVRIVIKDKEDETLTRIEQRTGRSRIEIVDEFGSLREKKIVRAEIFEGFSIIKVGQKFTTRTIDREALIKEIIERFAISDADVERLLKIEYSEDGDEEDNDRLRIKVKIIEKEGLGIAKVEVLLRRSINSTSESDITSAVSSFTQITREQIIDALIIKEEGNRNRTERKIEINSKTKNGIIFTRVKIEWDRLRQELILRTGDRQEIITQISKLLNVSPVGL
ncbi:MAG: DUF5667 domain-containing protein [Nanoarchaeota archaeon]